MVGHTYVQVLTLSSKPNGCTTYMYMYTLFANEHQKNVANLPKLGVGYVPKMKVGVGDGLNCRHFLKWEMVVCRR